MSAETVPWPGRLRAVPWAVWVLLILAALVAARGFTIGGLALGLLSTAAPLVFAAAVVYAAPADRRFVWGALAVAAYPAVNLVADVLPQAWFSTMPGDWKNAAALLAELGSGAKDVANLLRIVGLGVLGLAMGGVRTFMSAVILGFAGLVALANVIWVGAHPIELESLYVLGTTIGYAILNVMSWAFVFAAALESLRSLVLIGAGLHLASVVMNSALLWWRPGPGDNTDLLLLVFIILPLAGWLLLIAAPLRGEFNAATARSRASRGKAARRRAG